MQWDILPRLKNLHNIYVTLIVATTNSSRPLDWASDTANRNSDTNVCPLESLPSALFNLHY